MSHENYLHRRNQFTRSFNRLLARVQPFVSSWLGEKQAEMFMEDARQEYEELIPRIPYIGENRLLLGLFLPSSRYLAVYRALQRQGQTLEDAGRVVFLMGAEEARAVPYVGRRLIEALWFSQRLRGAQITTTQISGKFRYVLCGR